MADEPGKRNLGRGLSALLGGAPPERARRRCAVAAQPCRSKPLHPGRFQPRRHFAGRGAGGARPVDPRERHAAAAGRAPRTPTSPAPTRSSPASGAGAPRSGRGCTRCRSSSASSATARRSRSRWSRTSSARISSALEEAEGYRRLIEEFGHTQEALARQIGKSRSHVANTLRLLELPPAVRADAGGGQDQRRPRPRAHRRGQCRGAGPPGRGRGPQRARRRAAGRRRPPPGRRSTVRRAPSAGSMPTPRRSSARWPSGSASRSSSSMAPAAARSACNYRTLEQLDDWSPGCSRSAGCVLAQARCRSRPRARAGDFDQRRASRSPRRARRFACRRSRRRAADRAAAARSPADQRVACRAKRSRAGPKSGGRSAASACSGRGAVADQAGREMEPLEVAAGGAQQRDRRARRRRVRGPASGRARPGRRRRRPAPPRRPPGWRRRRWRPSPRRARAAPSALPAKSTSLSSSARVRARSSPSWTVR